MGVGESSLVQSVDDLSNVLIGLESKIKAIENSQVNLERTIANDGEIIILDKRIVCYQDVNLKVGPVIGLITHNAFKVLLEITKPTYITLNLYLVDKISHHIEYIISESVFQDNKGPCVHTVKNLSPDSRYLLYIGGICGEETLRNYATIDTLPSNPNNFKFIVMYKNFLDIIPGESDIWSTNIQNLSLNKKNDINNNNFPNISFHMGDFISIHPNLKVLIFELYCKASSPDTQNNLLVKLIDDIENEVKKSYIINFNNPKCAELFKYCGNIFLCGESEINLKTYLLLIMDEEQNDGNLNLHHDFTSTSLVKAENIIQKEFNSINTSNIEKLKDDRRIKTEVAGIVLRIMRKFYFAYLRQLWDDDYLYFVELNDKDETNLRNFFFQFRSIDRKISLNSHLELSLQKLTQEYGKNYFASRAVEESNKKLSIEISEDKIKLHAVLNDPDKSIAGISSKISHDVFICSEDIGIILIDSLWNILASDGNSKNINPYNTFLNISSYLFDALEKYLSHPKLKKIICLSSASYINSTDNNLRNSFNLLPTDVTKLLHKLSSWQQKDNERAVLLVFSNPNFTGFGSIHPVFTENDSEGWDPVRSKLSLLSVSSMSVHPNFSFTVSDNLRNFKSKNTLNGFDFLFSNIYSEKSFWKVNVLDVVPFNTVTQESCVPSTFQLNIEKSNDVRELELNIGPLIGEVTSSSVTILIESLFSGYVVMEVCDQVTGKGYEISRYCKSATPTIYKFDELSSYTFYEVYIYSEHISVEQKKSKNTRLKGSFTTCFKEDSESLKIMKNLIPKPKKPTVSIPDKISLSKFKLYSGRCSTNSYRILLLGSNRPSWSNHASNVIIGSNLFDNGDDYVNTEDREYIFEGNLLSSQLLELSSRGWDESFNLVVHIGQNVDINLYLQDVLSLISQAETCSDSFKKIKLLSTAFELVKSSYRVHWSSSSTRDLLAHSSHLFISSTLMDILAIFNSQTVEELERDLSPFVLSHLYEYMDSASLMYQKSVYKVDKSFRFIKEGEICLFILDPIFDLRNHNAEDNKLISEAQFLELENLLFEKSNNFKILIILSPIQIFQRNHDDYNLKFPVTYNITETRRLLDLVTLWLECYDLRSDISEEDSVDQSEEKEKFVKREASFLVGGSESGYISEIEINYKSENRGPSNLSRENSLMKIKQITCGIFVSAPGSMIDVSTSKNYSEALFNDQLNKSKGRYKADYTYKVNHFKQIIKPHCFFVDIITSNTENKNFVEYLSHTLHTLSNDIFSCPRHLSLTTLSPRFINIIWDESKIIFDFLEKESINFDEISTNQKFNCKLKELHDNIDENIHAIEKFHNLLVAENYGAPSKNLISISNMFAYLISDLVDELNSLNSLKESSILLKVPSFLMIAFTWIRFSERFEVKINSKSSNTEIEFESFHKSLFSLLIFDVNIFLRFVRQMLYSPYIFEFLSLKYGENTN